MRSVVLALAFLALSSCSSGNGTPGATLDAAPPADAAPDRAGAELSEDHAEGRMDTEPSCAYLSRHLIPGPCEEGWDAALDAKARRYDRCWTTWNAATFGVNTDVGVAASRVEDRALIEDWVQNHDGWAGDFEVFAGRPALDLVTGHNKVAGLYAGAGIIADAYRYGVLRDQGYPPADVEQARGQLLRALETLHIATAITGVEGVICRGLALKAWGYETVPLFDGNGAPLPPEKNNGVWREDNSPGHVYPELIWEDSVSRDMLIGWAGAFGASWEVIREDPEIPDGVKATLRADATALGRALMVVRESGYDLEVPDADGRTTLHGWLNEHNLDGVIYLPELENGFHAVMALGIVSSYAYASGDPVLAAWLQDDLITARELPRIVREHVAELANTGFATNFSNVNMVFMGFWLALRYVEDPGARAILRDALKNSMYDRPGENFQPIEYHYSFYDFTFAAGWADASAFGGMASEPLALSLDNGLDTLRRFREPPFWDLAVINCPAFEACTCEEDQCWCPPEATAALCLASDGETLLTPLGCKGWKCALIVAGPLPWDLMPPSNYRWRSAPHGANGGGDGGSLLPGVDFRFAYWMGRWTRR